MKTSECIAYILLVLIVGFGVALLFGAGPFTSFLIGLLIGILLDRPVKNLMVK